MVTFDKLTDDGKNKVRADVIILGCNLPGVVTAYNLKTRFGDAMDIVVLDLGRRTKPSFMNVTFQSDFEEDLSSDEVDVDTFTTNLARRYLLKYTKEFNIPLLSSIISPTTIETSLKKIFEYTNGKVTDCLKQYCDFDYLNYFEKFELTQYQNMLEQSMKFIFCENIMDLDLERKTLLYYDQTNMEKHICQSLLFSTSREIMRTIVRLVCGAPTTVVSILFYLHQCHRNNNVRDHLESNNMRIREKVLGYCRKNLEHEFTRSIEDITFSVKYIENIRAYSNERVVVETMKEKFVGNLLALALKPNELDDIEVESDLLNSIDVEMTGEMIPGRVRKFIIQYKENFWRDQGYSGDILSVRGPIVWAMERPKMSGTGSVGKYAALVGFLRVTEESHSCREVVIKQLVKLFGIVASDPVYYKETNIADIFVPRCGDYVALRKLVLHGSKGVVQWGTLDIFAQGDVAGALEAGHKAYLRLISCLRPQAQTYDDICFIENAVRLSTDNPVSKWISTVNYISALRCVVITTMACVGFKVVSRLLRR